MNYILDTLWEIWQYFKPNRDVYLVGKYYFGRLILIRMIPKDLPMAHGWEQLTQPMPIRQAEQRIQHFKLISIVTPKESPQMST